jgi:dTMP kinase
LDWQSLALLFAADRLDHVACEIEPALSSGQCVVSDRYTLSSLIYQSVTAPTPEAARHWVQTLNQYALVPDLVIVLDVAPDVAEHRRRIRGGKEELFDRREVQDKLALAYLEADRYLGGPVVHIDGSLPLSDVESLVFASVAQVIPELTLCGV